MKLAIALGAIFNGHYAASVADGIPVDSYTPQGTQAFLSLFASLGLSQFILGLLGIFLLFRYRPLVPLFLLMLLIEYLARKGINAYLPIMRSGNAPGGAINWAIFGVMLRSTIDGYRVIWPCHRNLTPRYRELISEARPHKRVHHLRSVPEISAFLNAVRSEPAVNAER